MMARLARSGSGRRSSALWIAVLLVLSFVGSAFCAEPRGTPPAIQRLYVPVDKPSLWPSGNRVPVDLHEFEALVAGAKAAPEGPQPARLERALYTATLDGDAFRGGRLEFMAKRFSPQPDILVMDPLNVALSHLSWSDGPAIWGTTPSGETALLMDRAEGEGKAEWTLQGLRLAQSVEFNVRVAPAVVSQLTLRLPEDRVLVTSGGDLAAPHPAPEAGWRLWRIDLGSLTACKLTVTRRARTGPAKPLVLVKNDFTYIVRQEAVRLQAEYRFEVLEGSIQEIRIRTGADVQVISLSYDASNQLAWKQIDTPAGKEISARLPDSVSGPSLPLKLQCMTRIKGDPAWVLPRPVLVDAVAVEGQLTMRVEPPLQLHDFKFDGYRQIDLTSNATEGETIVLRELRPDASAKILLGSPPFESTARVLTQVQTNADQWTAVSQIDWTARAGSAFSTSCQVPQDWEITDVQGEGTGVVVDLTGWEVMAQKDGRRTLLLTFLDSLAPERPKRVRISARRPAAPLNQPTPIPAFIPADTDDIESMVSISSETASRPVLDADSNFMLVTAKDLPAEWRDSPAWRERTSTRNARSLLLQSNLPVPAGSFSLQAPRDVVDVDVVLSADLSPGWLTERVLLRGNPQDGERKRILVYFSEAGPQPSWILQDASKTPLQSKLMPAANHSAWNLPATGELWEIRFPAPQTGEFVIAGSRRRPMRDSERISLVFVPHAREFRGTIEARTAAGMAVRFQSRALDRIPPAELIAVPGTSARGGGPRLINAWRFDRIGGELEVQVSTQDAQAAPIVVTRMTVVGHLSQQRGGFDMYWTEFQLAGLTHQNSFSIELDDPKLVMEIRLDGNRIAPRWEGRMCQVSAGDDLDKHALQIGYRVPSPGPFGPGRRAISMPRVQVPVLAFEFDVLLPPGARLAAAEGMSFEDPPAESYWGRSLFGPLTRGFGDDVFQPFRLESWRQLLRGAPEPVAVGDADRLGLVFPSSNIPSPAEFLRRDQDQFGASLSANMVGWTRRQAFAATVPDELAIVVWDGLQVRLLSWIGLLGCLIAGVVLRSVSGKLPGRSAMLAISVCGLLAWLLPPVYGEIAGGCLAGTMIALLLPACVLARARLVSSRQSSTVPPGSTQSFSPFAAGSFVIACLAWSLCATAADERPIGGVGATGPSIYSVLIPVGSDGKPAGKMPLVYAPEELLARLKRLRKAPRVLPAYLITAAEYDAALGDNQLPIVNAKFAIRVLSAEPVVRVQLALANANLGGPEACLLDGKSVSVFRASGGGGLAVDVPGAVAGDKRADARPAAEKSIDEQGGPGRTAGTLLGDSTLHVLQLRSHPPAEVTSASIMTRLSLPRICNAVLNIVADARWPMVECGGTISGATQVESVQGEPLKLHAALGRTADLQLQWRLTAPAPAAKAEVLAKTSCLIDIHPTFLQATYLVQCHVSSGRLEYLAWKLPAGMVIRSAPAAPDLLGYGVENGADNQRRLLLEFARPQTGDFEVHATFVYPLTPSGNSIRIPPLNLFAGDEPAYSVKSLLNQVALRQPTDFQPVVTADLESRFKPRSVEDFLKVMPVAGERPQAAFVWEAPAESTVELVPLTPLLKVRSRSIGHVVRDRLDWTFTADVETQAAPTFQYRLRVDPRLRITSISVQEDNAERLLRCSRSAENVVVFLTDKATRPQQLRLQGTTRVQMGRDFDIPFVEFAGATPQEARCAIYRSADIKVGLLAADQLARVEPATGEDPATGEALVASFDLTRKHAQLRLRVDHNTPDIRANSVSVLDARQPSLWTITAITLFDVRNGQSANFEIEVPQEFAGTFEVRTYPKSRHLQQPGRNGAVRISFSPDEPVDTTFAVSVIAPIATPTQSSWELPELQTPGVSKQKAYLLINEGARQIIPSSTDSGLRRAKLAEALEQSPLLPGDAAQWPCYQRTGGRCRLAIRESASQPAAVKVALADARLWADDAGNVQGRALLWLAPTDRKYLDISWPSLASPAALIINGQTQRFPKVAGGVCRIPLPLQHHHQTVLYAWSSNQAQFPREFGRLAVDMPVPREMLIERDFLALVPSRPVLLRPTRDFTPVSPWELFIGRWEAALELQHLFGESNLIDRRRTNFASTFRVDEMDARAAALSESAAGIPGPRELDRLSSIRSQLSDEYARERARNASRLKPFMELDVAPEWNSLLALPATLPARTIEASIDPQSIPAVWVARKSLVELFAGGIGALVLVCVALVTGRSGFWTWLQNHEALAWASLGAFWWLCLAPNWLGPCIVLLAAARAMINRRASAPQSSATSPPISATT